MIQVNCANRQDCDLREMNLLLQVSNTLSAGRTLADLLEPILQLVAKHRDLEKAVAEGKFRQDLLYRLDVFPIFVPPLRERRGDVPALADHFVSEFNRKNDTDIRRISSPAIDALMAYHWPGNVRELQNCIERACVLSQDGTIHAFHLPPSLQLPTESGPGSAAGGLEATMNRIEREMIADALKLTRGNMAKAAEHLGITERMMGIRVKKYEMEPTRYKG